MAKITATAIACLVLLVVLLLSATRTGAGRAAAESSVPVVEEKRSCLSQSHKFKGKCISDHNCRSICSGEGFPGGSCRGFRRRCFCARNC